MALIKILDIGYGLNNKTLNVTIALPKKTYLEHLYVAYNSDITNTNTTNVGIDYINKIMTIYNITAKEAFNKLFESKGEMTPAFNDTYGIWQVYTLKALDTDLEIKECLPLVDKDTINYITFKLNADSISAEDYIKSSNCGEDNTELIVPLYDTMTLKLDALKYYNSDCCTCDLSVDFINKILQIRAIELALCTKNYYKASCLWQQFYSSAVKNQPLTSKSCNCHG